MTWNFNQNCFNSARTFLTLATEATMQSSKILDIILTGETPTTECEYFVGPIEYLND
jgi:hypothetical protein